MSDVALFVIASSQDDSTSAGASLVKSALKNEWRLLFGQYAIATKAHPEVMKFPAIPIFFTGHGAPDACVGSDAKPVFEAGQVGWDKKKDTVVFALACYTARNLGLTLADNHGVIWMGYDKPVSAIPRHSKSSKVIVEFLGKLMEMVSHYASNRNRLEFENELRACARSAQKALTKIRNFQRPYLSAAVALQDWIENLVIHDKATEFEPLATGQLERLLK